MTEEATNLILEQFRIQRSEFRELRSEMHSEFKDIKHRLTQLELHGSAARRETVNVQEDVYRQQATIDGIVDRIIRIERRLELS